MSTRRRTVVAAGLAASEEDHGHMRCYSLAAAAAADVLGYLPGKHARETSSAQPPSLTGSRAAERCEWQTTFHKMQLHVDERCRDRCEKLLENLNSCAAADASHGQPAAQSCSTHMARFRDFCVSNSACNPSGRQQDPARLSKRCAALAKRVRRCDESSIDGRKDRISNSSDCQDQRARFRALCDSLPTAFEAAAAASDPSALSLSSSASITASYRDAAAAAATHIALSVPAAELVDDSLLGRLADAMAAGGAEGDERGAEAVASPLLRPLHAYPLSSSACVLLLGGGLVAARRAATAAVAAAPSASAQNAAASSGAQRLMQARVVGQAAIVATLVGAVGVGQLVDLGLRRRQWRAAAVAAEKKAAGAADSIGEREEVRRREERW